MNDHGGDLTRRWYVYYQYRNPNTGKLDDFKVYKGVNRVKTVTERRKKLKQLKVAMERLLDDGFSPFEKYKKGGAVTSREETDILAAIDHVVEVKKAYLKSSSFKTFEARIKIFKAYLKDQGKGTITAREISRSDITDFLSWVQRTRKIGNFSRNNYLADIKGLFTKLVEEEYTGRNPTLKIADLPANPKKNRAFSSQQIEVVKSWMLEYDPNLYKFIRWVTYAFLRPVEVCRIQVKHIDLENALLYIPTKTKSEKVRRIIPRLLDDLKEINIGQYQPEDYLFTKHGHPGPWLSHRDKKPVQDMERRTWFGNRFKLLKKDIGLGPEYGIYSFRHSAVGDIYKSITSAGYTSYHAKMIMMPITGHDTLQALDQYLREAQIEIAEDHSGYINLDF